MGGHRVLGSVIGSSEACHAFQSSKLTEYTNIVNKLASHAKKSPQNVYHAFTKGVQHKLTFLSRTTPDMENTLQNTESLLTTKLIFNITGRVQLSIAERSLFSLPLSKGGLNILSPEDRRNDLQWSKDVTFHLDEEDLTTAEAKQHSTVNLIKKQKQEIQKTKLEEVKCNLNDKQRHAVTLVSEKRASSWLAALPLKRYGITLTKSEFRDSLALRYGWEPKNLPAKCPCGGEPFTVAHSLHCRKGGYTHMRHDEIRDTFAKIMKDVCFDVEVEPKLQRLEGESFDYKSVCTEDEARLDIRANELWDSRFSRTYFDVKIFNPLAKSCPKEVKESYKYHETLKKLKCEQRILDVENSSFNPLVFACSGGAGPSASKVMSRLALMISEKGQDSYSDAIGYIRTQISYALLRSSVLCLRGSRSTR